MTSPIAITAPSLRALLASDAEYAIFFDACERPARMRATAISCAR